MVVVALIDHHKLSVPVVVAIISGTSCTSYDTCVVQNQSVFVILNSVLVSPGFCSHVTCHNTKYCPSYGIVACCIPLVSGNTDSIKSTDVGQRAVQTPVGIVCGVVRLFTMKYPCSSTHIPILFCLSHIGGATPTGAQAQFSVYHSSPLTSA